MSKRVLITGARAPVAVDMALLFHRAGAEVHVADSTPVIFAAGLKCVSGHRLPPARGNLPAYAQAVSALVKRLNIDLVVPTCEEVFHLAAARDAGCDIPLLAPPMPVLRVLHDKFAFIEFARAQGLDVPETRLLTSEADVAALAGHSRELVFKPCFSRFAVETRIGPVADRLKRIKPTLQSPWVAQELLKGQEFCIYAVALGGELIAFSAYRPLYRLGQASGYYFEPVDLPEGERFAARIAAATGFDGQISFDMMQTPDRGLLPIECNPRATSGMHLLADRVEIAERLFARSASSEIIRAAPSSMPATCASVMWVFGLLPAIAEGRLGRWRADKNRARDIFAVPGNSLNLHVWRAIGSYWVEAIRKRRPVRAVAAGDIEWDGEPLNVA